MPVPKQFPKYISNAANKVSPSAILTEAWIEKAKQRLLADKELVIGGGATEWQLALSIKNGECTEVTALYCDHEEVDMHRNATARQTCQSRCTEGCYSIP